MSQQKYDENYNRFLAKLPENYQVVERTAQKVVLRRTDLMIVEKGIFWVSYPKWGSVSHELILKCERETGKPTFHKKLIEKPIRRSELEVNLGEKAVAKLLEQSFSIDYRESWQLKLTLNAVFYYWENKDGQLVITNIR